MSRKVTQTIFNPFAEDWETKIVHDTKRKCVKHNNNIFIEQSNQGGHDGTVICLYCVLDVIKEY